MGFEPMRENDLPFFKQNKIATPARVTSFNSTGGSPQPKLDKDYMEDTGIGKGNDQRDPNISAYNPNKYNVS